MPTPVPSQPPGVTPRAPAPIPQAPPPVAQMPPPVPPSSSPPAAQYQAPAAPPALHQYSCPQCGAGIDIESGQCRRCGLLLGKNLLLKMQQEAAASAPAVEMPVRMPVNPPSVSMAESAPSQQYSGGYITGAQPRSSAASDVHSSPASGYLQEHSQPSAMPHDDIQQPAVPLPPASVSVTPPPLNSPQAAASAAPPPISPPPATASAAPSPMSPPQMMAPICVPAAMSPPPPRSFSGELAHPAPREWAIPPSTRRFLINIALTILFAVIGIVGIFYVISLFMGPSSDTTPPTIGGISVSSITQTGAVIQWETNEPAISQVTMCDPEDLCHFFEGAQTPDTSHSITLSGLNPDTTYHYTLIVKDDAGNEATSEGELTTSGQDDTTPPAISEVNVSDITESSATINWITDEEATSWVKYGKTETYKSTTPVDEGLTMEHSVTLTGLEPDTTYHFSARSKDAGGNRAFYKDRTFTTSAPLPVGHEEGNRALDFTLEDIDGEEVTLSDLRGKIVIVNFWATTCSPCVAEMPHIQAVFDDWSDEELVVLAINMGQSAGTVRSFMNNEGFTFPVLLDSGDVVANDYDVRTIPRTFFIDADGVIRTIQFGSFSSQQEIENILESL